MIKIVRAMMGINWLMYKSYEFQRTTSPEVKPERLRKLYINSKAYEEIYQLLKNGAVHKGEENE